MSRTGYNGGSVSTDPDELTLANVKDGTIKYKNLRKNKLQLLCGTLLKHIKDLELELRLKKAKVEKAKVKHRGELKELKKTVGDLELELRLEKAMAPHNVSTPNKTFELRAELKELKETVKDLELELRLEKAEPLHNVELRAELKELKEAIFVHKNGTNATSNGEDDVKGVVNTADVTCRGGRRQRNLQQGKVGQAGQVGQASQVHGTVVPVAVRPTVAGGQGQAEEGLPGEPPGEVCTANNCGNKHPKVCLVADHGKGKIPKATYTLWHIRVPFAGPRGKSQGKPPASRGTAATTPSTLSSSRQSTVLRSSRQGSGQRR
jgi:hypothetical protein